MRIRSIGDIGGWDIFPAVVKPADTQGQRGVFLVNSAEEIEAAVESSLGISRCYTVILEESLTGPEVSVNAFVVDSEVVFSEVSDRLTVECSVVGIPRGHIFPSRYCRGEPLEETREMVERCIYEFGISNGPVYFQVKVTADGPRIIEVTPRLDGCHLWRLIKTVKGIDLLELSMDLLIEGKFAGGGVMDSGGIPNGDYRYLEFLMSPPGEVFRKADYTVPDDPSFLEYYYDEGQTIRPVNGVMEKVGYFIEGAK